MDEEGREGAGKEREGKGDEGGQKPLILQNQYVVLDNTSLLYQHMPRFAHVFAGNQGIMNG